MMYWIPPLYLLFVNVAAFLAFRADKQRAQHGSWRISEGTLLGLSFLGGWFGAKRAQRQYRHKTRKQTFAIQLNAIPLLWGFIAVGLLVASQLPQGPTSPVAGDNTWQTPRFFQSVRN